MIKNLIFDFGGVVIDLNRANAVKGFEAIGVANAEELLDVYHQQGILLELEEGQITDLEFCAKIEQIAGRKVSYEEVSRAWLSFFEHDPQYKLDFINGLRTRYRVLLLSNTNPFIMRWARSKDFTAAGRPLDDYVDNIYLSYQIKALKPNPKIFEYMINDAGIDPAESIFIDDGPANIEVGRKLGFHTLQALNGEDWRSKLEFLIRSIK